MDARLDQFLLKPGMDIPQWMTNEIVKASKVILVCDSSYVIKADTRSAGVGWESMIIQGDILSHGTTSRKYIPIAFDNVSENIPLYLRTKLWLPRTEVDEDDGRLLRHFTASRIRRSRKHHTRKELCVWLRRRLADKPDIGVTADAFDRALQVRFSNEAALGILHLER